MGQTEFAQLFPPGITGIWRDIARGQEANADRLKIAGLGHFPAELGEFVFGNVDSPLDGFDKATATHFEIDDFADAFFNGGVVMGIDKRGVFGEVIETPASRANATSLRKLSMDSSLAM